MFIVWKRKKGREGAEEKIGQKGSLCAWATLLSPKVAYNDQRPFQAAEGLVMPTALAL